jgi:paxillin
MIVVVRCRCNQCHKPIFNEDSISAMGGLFHIRCFVCSHCGIPLSETQEGSEESSVPAERTNVRYFEHSGQVRCRRLRHHRLTLRQVYCRKDYLELFADRCGGCGFPITGRCIRALDKKWHDECFVCNECELPVSSSAEDGAKHLQFFQVPVNMCIRIRIRMSIRVVNACTYTLHISRPPF